MKIINLLWKAESKFGLLFFGLLIIGTSTLAEYCTQFIPICLGNGSFSDNKYDHNYSSNGYDQSGYSYSKNDFYEYRTDHCTSGHCGKKLHSYNKEQLENYFSTRGYSEEKIFSLFNLYCSDEFINLIKERKNYKKTIKNLHCELKDLSKFRRFLRIFGGKYYPRLKDRIAFLYNEMCKAESYQKRFNNENRSVIRTDRCNESEIRYFSRIDTANDVANILTHKNSYESVAQALDQLASHVFAQSCVNSKSTIEQYVNDSIDNIRFADNCFDFAFNVAVVDHVLYDVQSSSERAIFGYSMLQRSSELLSRGVVKFITSLNPVEQLKNIVSTVGHIALHPIDTMQKVASFTEHTCSLLVNTAHFVADVTIGKCYLSPQEYRQRIDSFWQTTNNLSECITDLSAENWVDLVAQLSADFVFYKGVASIGFYLKELGSVEFLK